MNEQIASIADPQRLKIEKHCPKCGGPFTTIAAINESAVIERIWPHLRLQARALMRADCLQAAGMGLVSSLARPQAHVTGVSLLFAEVEAKRLELLHAPPRRMPGAKHRRRAMRW